MRPAIPTRERDQRAAVDLIDACIRGIAPRTRAPTVVEGGLRAWARRYLSHYLQQPESPFHVWLCGELDRIRAERGQTLDVIAPRGSAKSTWCITAYALQAICEGAERYVVIASETSDQAEQQLATIKHELENNRLLARDYPDAAGVGPQWSMRRIRTRNAIRVDALGVGRSLRGRREREERPTLVLIDDPDGELHAYSPIKRERTWQWWTRSVSKAGGPSTNFVVAGTMIHDECTVARLRKQPGVRSRVWREIISWPERLDLWGDWERLLPIGDDAKAEAAAREFYDTHRADMDRGVELLWPARWPLYALMRERASSGHSSFLAERQNESVPTFGTKWPAENFVGDDLYFDELPEGNGSPVPLVAVDPAVGKRDSGASKRGTGGCYAAIVWGWWVPGDRHLYIDADLARRPPARTHDALIQLHRLHNFRACAYESNGYQGEIAVDLSTRAAAAGLFLSVQPVEHMLPKEMRIDSLGPFLDRRHFRFRRGSPGADLLLRQLRLYAVPKVEEYDGPDALEMLVGLFRQVLAGFAGENDVSVAGHV